jgi:hypothetical protein
LSTPTLGGVRQIRNLWRWERLGSHLLLAVADIFYTGTRLNLLEFGSGFAMVITGKGLRRSLPKVDEDIVIISSC